MAVTKKEGYVNGSDLLLYVETKAVGHCSSHKATFNSETKAHAVKAAASKPISSSLFKGKSVTGLSISVSAEGISFYNEEECGFKDLFKLWKAGKSIKLKCAEREKAEQPYMVGDFVITSLEQNAPAQDDATYSASFENDGEPETLDESAITEGAAA